MTNNFPKFAKIVADSFQKIAKDRDVFVTGTSGDELYEV
jgi:hypothetical protein